VRLLDLFCGAGGAAMGYHRAGFDEIVGVDIEPQPRYPFEFVQADALEFPLGGFDAIHASPPCQGYSALRHLPWLRDREYPLLIGPTRERLREQPAPWVIENVMRAPLGVEFPGFVLCGAGLGLSLSRHRRFEASFAVLVPPCPGHKTIQPGRMLGNRYKAGRVTGVASDGATIREIDRDSVAGHFSGVDRAREAMGIDWMTGEELSQAIPPAYTEFIGEQLLAHLNRLADLPRA
jgi:DNA (cytosine-5)-methyltransferase 1